MIKEPDNLKADLEALGYEPKLYSSADTAKYSSLANLFELDNIEGVHHILIADGGTNKDTAKPLIVFFCSSKEVTDRVFNDAKDSIEKFVSVTGLASAEDCNLTKVDNTVIVGHPEMIKIAKAGF
jgi:hypothetical protein